MIFPQFFFIKYSPVVFDPAGGIHIFLWFFRLFCCPCVIFLFFDMLFFSFMKLWNKRYSKSPYITMYHAPISSVFSNFPLAFQSWKQKFSDDLHGCSDDNGLLYFINYYGLLIYDNLLYDTKLLFIIWWFIGYSYISN